jgi:hypothetical protein
MSRQSVADLLQEADQEAPAASAVVPPRPMPPDRGEAAAAAQPEASAGSRGTAPRQRRHPQAGTSEPAESQTPKWKGLERKELRLRADQLDELARLRRNLNRKRGGEGERITENTLIRVAVDLLLTRSSRLRGVTEDELRKSVTS